MPRRFVLLRTVLAALAGVALSLAFEPVGVAWIVPPAVAAYVLLVRDVPLRWAWLPGLAFGVGFYFTLIWWMRAVGPDAWAALSSMEAFFYGVLGPVTAVLCRRRWWPLWTAAAWVAMETIRSSQPFSGMPWGRLGYAVAGTPWENALPYVGQAGVAFLLALLASCLAWLVTARHRAALVATLGVAAAGLLPALAPYTVDTVGTRTVAVVQGNVPGDGDDILYDPLGVTTNHVDATLDLAADVDSGAVARPDFVLWPENSTAYDPFAKEEVHDGILRASEAIDVPILVGAMVDAGEEHVLNQGVVWDPETGAGDRYTKWHPVPFGEYIPWRSVFRSQFGRLAEIPRDMQNGTRVEPLEIADTRVADAICFDVAYDDGIYTQVGNGGELLVVQTSNATFIHTDQIDQQFEITRLRAVETGRYLVVAATNGVSGVIAPDGTVLDTAAPRTQQVLVEEVGLSRDLTPAVRMGLWPGRAAVAVTVLALLAGLLPYRRRVSNFGVAA